MLALFLVRWNFVIVFFLRRYFVITILLLANCVADCSNPRCPRTFGQRVLCWAFAAFFFNGLAWWWFPSRALTVVSLLFSFSNQFGLTATYPYPQLNSSYWRCCCLCESTGSTLYFLRWTVMVLPTIPTVLQTLFEFLGCLFLRSGWFRHWSMFLFRIWESHALFLTCLDLEAFWLSSRLTLRIHVKSVNVVSSEI